MQAPELHAEIHKAGALSNATAAAAEPSTSSRGKVIYLRHPSHLFIFLLICAIFGNHCNFFVSSFYMRCSTFGCHIS